MLLRSTAETCSSWFSEEINPQLHTLLPLDFSWMQTVFPRAKITHRLHYEHSHLWVYLLRTGLLRISLLWMLSVMNVVWCERGLLRTACMICYEHGLLWTWSVMNVFYYEHGGLLWKWSVMIFMNWSVLNVVCFKWSFMSGLLWAGLFWTDTILNILTIYKQASSKSNACSNIKS